MTADQEMIEALKEQNDDLLRELKRLRQRMEGGPTAGPMQDVGGGMMKPQGEPQGASCYASAGSATRDMIESRIRVLERQAAELRALLGALPTEIPHAAANALVALFHPR